MKRILVVATGGTIGSTFRDGCRRLSVNVAESTLLEKFLASDSPYAELGQELFFDSHCETQTLSENMTVKKWNEIVSHLACFALGEYSGVIILHGTDTLAYTASLLSLLFCDTPVPIVLVSGNCPPDEEQSNANANFRSAVELICEGLAPNIYVTYRNSDGKLWLRLGTTLMQCPNFSEDFSNASRAHEFLARDERSDQSQSKEEMAGVEKRAGLSELFRKCAEYSAKRHVEKGALMRAALPLRDSVLMLYPHVGMNYRRVKLKEIQAVIHGTYHSGTLSADQNAPSYSVIPFGKRCKKKGIALYAAPCVLDENQYESAFEAKTKGGMIPLNLTLELAYCKLMIGTSLGLRGESLYEFMLEEINSEYRKSE